MQQFIPVSPGQKITLSGFVTGEYDPSLAPTIVYFLRDGASQVRLLLDGAGLSFSDFLHEFTDDLQALATENEEFSTTSVEEGELIYQQDLVVLVTLRLPTPTKPLDPLWDRQQGMSPKDWEEVRRQTQENK